MSACVLDIINRQKMSVSLATLKLHAMELLVYLSGDRGGSILSSDYSSTVSCSIQYHHYFFTVKQNNELR